MFRNQQVTEFDIVRVKPHVDLVLFDNVISCYPCDKDITVNYVLGQDVSPSSWDWVGIFRIDWRYLGDYLSYQWAQIQGQDCNAPRRRAIVFSANYHQIPPSDQDLYQFLYVSRGNHVVGVSASFKITDPEVLSDFCIAALYEQPYINVVSKKQRTRKARVPISDTFEIINELPCPSIPKRRAKTKQKVIAVYRDPETLVNIGNFDLSQKFRIPNVLPVVQEYNQTSHVPYNRVKELKIFDIRWGQQQTPSTSGSNEFPIALKYPVYEKLKAGPQAFLLSLQETGNDCSSCLVAKTLVQDLVDKEFQHEEKLRNMKVMMDAVTMLNIQSKNEQARCVGLLDLALSQVQEDNKTLQKRVDDLEALLFEASSQLQEKLQTESAVPKVSDDDYGTWMVRYPKRIARIKKVVGRQSRTLQMLRQCNETKQRQVNKLQNENIRLRRLVQSSFETSDKFRGLAEELNQRIKSVLAERSKDHTNEWRQFVRNVQETTTQTLDEKKENRGTSPKSTSSTSCASGLETSSGAQTPVKHRLRNKQITRVLRSEKHQRQKLHKDINQEEQCPTCGLKFSKKTDRRVIEEHIVFHTYHDKKNC
ncbi:tax1-binding protein 1 homolog B-like isoform X2 [Ruditapes philippinarum]|uniref:tax1-binding protein 1 homolog B-like isoform X2 n=1 Tax=Ruditapes philippinarum TaxID=129788 RepID=UPI00295AE917|nr:tax1-binding protein 1 homolog B-like isoform X2 [Ruditapes philippinarum]